MSLKNVIIIMIIDIIVIIIIFNTIIQFFRYLFDWKEVATSAGSEFQTGWLMQTQTTRPHFSIRNKDVDDFRISQPIKTGHPCARFAFQYNSCCPLLAKDNE